MQDKHETAKNKDSLFFYVQHKDYVGLEETTPPQLNKNEIFIDFLNPVIEDLLTLIQIFPLKELMGKVEQTIIISALDKCGGNQNKTAKFLKVKPTTLCTKIKKYNISFKKIPFKD